MGQLRKRLTYANVMSSIAVFLVLGGATAIAASQLGKNSVGSKQLKRNAVTAAKIKNNAVTGGKIRNGAVTADKLGAGAVGGGSLAPGAVTAEKIANGAILAGKLGPIVTRTQSGAIPGNELGTLLVSCQPGEVLLSGGADWERKGPDLLLQLAESARLDADTWRATGNNLNAGAVNFRVYAYCLAP